MVLSKEENDMNMANMATYCFGPPGNDATTWLISFAPKMFVC